jgi:glucuronate isomerase
MLLNEDRLFPIDNYSKNISRELYNEVKNLPIICPHGHTDPQWFSENKHFTNATELLIIPDHYLLRMLVSQGIKLENMGIKAHNNLPFEQDHRKIWKLFAKNYYLFRSTPTRMWLDHTFQNLFNIDVPLNEKSADYYFDHINNYLNQDSYRPREMYEKFNIEVLTTTEDALSSLSHHQNIKNSTWDGRVISTYRPDNVTDPDFEGFIENIKKFGDLCGEDTFTWLGYLNAHKKRRAYFISLGVKATDHGHPTPATVDLSTEESIKLYTTIIKNEATIEEKELFRAQMLMEMAKMSLEDGLVMQIHPGSHRNHSSEILKIFGRDKGFDIPTRTSYVEALKPLLNKFGNESKLKIILFTLDESVYSRELAPLAGVYPCLKLGPSWWFHDSPNGMMRYREAVTETAGYYNTVGFNDDTRAFPSIPARHDVARRVDCAFLANQIAKHIITEEEGKDIAIDLSYNLPKVSYNL